MLSYGIFGGLALFLYLFRKYRESQWGYCKESTVMDGKVIIITGANSGIGKETARELAKRGAIVVLACRNKLFALEAVKDIRTTTGNGDLIIIELDLANLSSVKQCALNLIEKFPHIDILINNAGVAYPSDVDVATADGFEIHFGVNHLGHFLFTNLLLDRIKETQGSRIVIVSSALHKNGVIDFETLSSPEKSRESIKNRPKIRNPLYSDSKLCNILHGQELKRRLVGTGTGVYVLCPGFVYTGLFRYSLPKYNWIQKFCFLPIAYLFMRSPKQGAQTSVYCATSKELDGVPFGFLRNCRPSEFSTPLASDESLASRLWDFSSLIVQRFQSV